MNTCLKNIVTLQACEDESSLSGFYLLQAPEISINALSAIANSTNQTGRNLAQAKLDLAVQLVTNDFIAALQANNVMTNLDATVHDSSEIKPSVSMGTTAAERGVTVIRNGKGRGSLRVLFLTDVQVYPLADAASVQMKVYDENNGDLLVSTYNVALVANSLNTFKLNYTVKGKWARVAFDNTTIAFASAPVKCGEGCGGRLPNDCGYARGWNGFNDIQKGDGYGVNVRFKCECDYDQLLCNLSRSYVGEIVWLKARVLILEEHLRTDRFNNWVIYGKKETKEYKDELENEYREKWNGLIAALPNLLKNYNDDCISCRGVRWVVNV